MWTDAYVGLPFKVDGYDRDGVDCYGLVHLVYREQLGVILPSWQGTHAAARGDWSRLAKAMEQNAELWGETEVPKEYDVVLMRRGPLACHVGLYAGNGLMLHICEGIDSAVEAVNGLRWGKRIVGYYRHV